MSDFEGGQLDSVLTCIAAILTVYYESFNTIERLKAQRAEQRAAPPPRILEEVVDQAMDEIDREKIRGLSRFTRDFEEGDAAAVTALQHIIVEVQTTLLDKLRGAASNENTNFTELVDAADLGRDKTIGALLELRQRLMELPANSPDTTPRASQAAQGGQQQVQPKEPEQPLPPTKEPESSKDSVTPGNTSNPSDSRGPSKSEGRRSQDEAGASKATPPSENQQTVNQRNRHGSILGFLRHVRERSNSRRKEGEDDESWPQTLPSHPGRPSESGTSTPGATWKNDSPQFTYEEGDSSWSRQRPSQDSSRAGRNKSVQLSPDEAVSSSTKNSRTNSIVTVSNASSNSRTVTPAAFSNSATVGTSIRQPTPENNYLGFCKGAWKLQNGDRKAMQKSKEFNDGWSQSSVYCLTCTAGKCAFAGHIAIEQIWTKVWNVEPLGLQFRWAFLAKSHVMQAKVKERTFQFQCLFCTLLGWPPALLLGTDAYLDHVSKEHRGRQLSEVLLYKTGCVVDHICGEDEDFDINLFPLTMGEQADLDLKMREEQMAEEASAAAARTRGDKQDSAPSEAWNEGLSDFHYDDELEATEKEN